jgi:5-hydroxyisourate hydrolase-like protein (transthyretin family)
MKLNFAFVLTFIVAANAFAEQVLYCAGKVCYPSGAPAAGVRVEYYPGFHFGAGKYAEVRTDANGRYGIMEERDTDAYDGVFIESNSIMARDFENNLAAIQNVHSTITNVDLVLQPAITLSGSVKDTEGVPIIGAEVELRFRFGMSHVLEAHLIKVNELGQFSMSALPRGREYEVFGVTAKGYGFETADASPKDTWTNRYEFPAFVLKHADQKIAGQVLDKNGKPFTGIEVAFSGRGQPMNSKEKWGQQPFCNTKTDNEGKFSFDNACNAPLRVCVYPHDNVRYNGGSMKYQDTHGGDTNIVIRLNPE